MFTTTLSKFQLADIDILSILIKHNMLIICICIVIPFIVPLYICSCSPEMEDNKSLSMYFGLTVETEGEVCLAAGQVPRPGEDVGGLPHPGTARTNEE